MPAWATRRKCRSSVISATPRSPKSTRAPARSSAWSSPATRPACASFRPAPRRIRSPAEAGHLFGPFSLARRCPRDYNSRFTHAPARKQLMNAHALASAESLDAIVAALADPASQPDKDLLEVFARSFYARVPDEELCSRDAGEWAAIARGFLAFARQRTPGTVSVSIGSPTLASDGYESTHTVVRIVNDDMPFLVDSVRMALSKFDITLHQIAHPVVSLRRDAAGQLQAVGEGEAESL